MRLVSSGCLTVYPFGCWEFRGWVGTGLWLELLDHIRRGDCAQAEIRWGKGYLRYTGALCCAVLTRRRRGQVSHVALQECRTRDHRTRYARTAKALADFEAERKRRLLIGRVGHRSQIGLALGVELLGRECRGIAECIRVVNLVFQPARNVQADHLRLCVCHSTNARTGYHSLEADAPIIVERVFALSDTPPAPT